jgi:endonuclease YncB( thermonuclease family)
VVAVADGDTITVLDAAQRQTKVRLSGIGAPEKKQPYGRSAKQRLSDLVFGKVVDVDWERHDRYGRIIGMVLAPDENCAAADCAKKVDAGLAQLSAGLAWHYKQYAKEQPRVERERYAAAETGAHLKGLGLWPDPHPTPPWEWRHPRLR